MDLDFNQPPVAGSNTPTLPAVDAPVMATSQTPAPSVPTGDPIQPASVATASETSPTLPNVNSSQYSPEPPVATPIETNPISQMPDIPELEEKKPSKIGKLILIIVIILVLGGVAYFLLMTSIGKSLIGLGSKEATTLTNQPSLTGQPGTDVLGNPQTTPATLGTGTLGGTPATSTTPATLTPATTSLATSAERDNKRKQDLTTLQTYIESYFADKGSYPLATTPEKLTDTTSSISIALVPTYATMLPTDPKASEGYYYGYNSVDGKSYQITARLEDTTDPSGIFVGSVYLYKVTGPASSGAANGAATTFTPTSTTTPTTSTSL